MTWTPERSTVNQKVQLGVESTSALGTAVAATKLIECFDWTFGINGDIKDYGATGRKYDLVREENTEWVDLTVGGEMDYNGLVYLMNSVYGSTASVSHLNANVAQDWNFVPPVTGSIVPQTYTLQQGDAVRAHQTAYSLINSFGYTITRKETKVTSKGITRPISDGITMTSNPTAIALAPLVPKQVNYYLDSSSSALGTTQLLKVLQCDYAFDGVYGPTWFMNRATPGFSSHVDLKPKTTVKLKLEADAQGMALLTYLQQGVTYYLQVNALGNLIDNSYTVSLGSPTAGTWTLTYGGQTTSALAYNVAAGGVKTALQALSSINPNTVTVTGSATSGFVIGLNGPLLNNPNVLTGSGAGLTGGTFVLAAAPAYNAMTHNMAIKVGKPSTFSDDAGIFAIEWECNVVEDPVWGNAQTITVTNVLTSL